MCNLEFTFHEYHLPSFPVPEGYTNEAYFREICMKGFRERYENPPQEYTDRLEYEISVISRMGYVNYYLIVWDFIRYAKEQGIPVGPGRGSGAASIVAYCMHITEVDPMKYALIFERFLNPERVSMPDFDTDFCQERRGEVIEYVMRKYGADHVAQIATFGTMAARGAIRDVGRALNFTYAETDVVAKLVPTTLHITLDEALKVSPKLKEMYDGDERVKLGGRTGTKWRFKVKVGAVPLEPHLRAHAHPRASGFPLEVEGGRQRQGTSSGGRQSAWVRKVLTGWVESGQALPMLISIWYPVSSSVGSCLPQMNQNQIHIRG